VLPPVTDLDLQNHHWLHKRNLTLAIYNSRLSLQQNYASTHTHTCTNVRTYMYIHNQKEYRITNFANSKKKCKNIRNMKCSGHHTVMAATIPLDDCCVIPEEILLTWFSSRALLVGNNWHISPSLYNYNITTIVQHRTTYTFNCFRAITLRYV